MYLSLVLLFSDKKRKPPGPPPGAPPALSDSEEEIDMDTHGDYYINPRVVVS